jgi:hypothetical protein
MIIEAWRPQEQLTAQGLQQRKIIHMKIQEKK